MRRVMALMTLAMTAGGAGATGPETRLADSLLRLQVADGAYIMGTNSNRVVPYFGNLAGIGMVEAYRATKDVRYLESARRWSVWYEARMQANGVVDDYTGSSGAWTSTGKHDSTDSYAATWLELVDAIQTARPEPKTARLRMPGAKKAIAAINLTMQPNGLTLATPTWPVMYTMDNVEVWRGLKAAARIAKRCGSETLGTEWQTMADRCAASIERDLWDASLGSYYIGIQPDGGKMKGLAVWYPDVMANLMAIGWGPSSSRHTALHQKLKTSFASTLPSTITTEDNVEHAVWWGFAAKARGDKEALKGIRNGLGAYTGTINNPATLGHAIRLLTS